MNSKREKQLENSSCPTLPKSVLETSNSLGEKWVGLVCPNCGAGLEGRKCKLVCSRRGCGYLVTCSEW